MQSSNIVYYLIAFSNVILSLPFTFFGLTKYQPTEIKANWQPPGYVFGIVWPILYMLFGLINMNIMSSKNLITNVKDVLIIDSLSESLMQSFWLLVTANFGNGRYFIQHLVGLLVLGVLVKFSYSIRIPSFKKYNKTSLYLYIPYSLWIIFAFILNLQIVLKYIL